ncbi:MAG TPA: hypothetical protein VL866_23480 [Pyrinomonadaceae bacterium]|nr:hypothetical protein [Pyrinomonadaceae bacterium]
MRTITVRSITHNLKEQQTERCHAVLTRKTLCLTVVFGLILASLSLGQTQTNFIPKTWDTEAINSFQLPIADSRISTKFISSSYYYSIPVRPIYKSYEVYRPDREPRGYMDQLRREKPQLVFDSSKLNSEADWTKAGEMVFDAPIDFVADGTLYSEIRGMDWFVKNKVPVTSEGVMPFMRWVVRQKGKVELGILSCGQCHTRVMPDGTLIKGAQGNFPDDRAFGYELRIAEAKSKNKDSVRKRFLEDVRRSYGAPWIKDDASARADRMSVSELASVLEAITPGSCARQGTSLFYPAAIPDLIGLKDRLYLDSTGLGRQRSIGDLMRYAALNQGADELTLYDQFRPVGKLPAASTQSRYSDEQLYALSLYIYSLKPPDNPNKFTALAKKGYEVFMTEACDACHTPPLYTNNMLLPVAGFKVDLRTSDVLNIPINTDPNLALNTRRGTGYYKVPSLKGVWYRGPFEHSGSVATLEDWFDPRRLRDDYTPTAFRGYGVTTRAVKGHEFGLSLTVDERKALIEFLKTL